LEGNPPLAADEALQLAIQQKLIDHLLPFERVAQDFVYNVLHKISDPQSAYVTIDNLTIDAGKIWSVLPPT